MFQNELVKAALGGGNVGVVRGDGEVTLNRVGSARVGADNRGSAMPSR